MSIYGPDEDDEPAQRANPTGVQGGGTRAPRPDWAREGHRGGSPTRIPVPQMGTQEANPFRRTTVPRHAVVEGERGRADPAKVPVDLVSDIGAGGRAGGPIYAFPEDPRNPSNYGARDRELRDETVVWAAMHDPTVIVPDYLGDWLYLRAEHFALEPPAWCVARLARIASYPGKHQQAAYRLYEWCGQLVAEMRRTQQPRR